MTLGIFQSMSGRERVNGYELDTVFLMQEDEFNDRERNRIFILLRAARTLESNTVSEVDIINSFVVGPTEESGLEMGTLEGPYLSYEAIESELPQPGVVDGGVL